MVATKKTGTSAITTENITTTEHEHDYGKLQSGKVPSFFHNGNIQYFHCDKCGKYFDINKNEVDTINIPKLSKDLALYTNGEYCCDFSLVEEGDDYIKWRIVNAYLNKNDIISIRSKDDERREFQFKYVSSYYYLYDSKCIDTYKNATINVTYTKDGAMELSMGEEGYNDLCVIITRNGVRTIDELKPTGLITKGNFSGFYYLEIGDEIEVYNFKYLTSYGFECYVGGDHYFQRSVNNKIEVKEAVRAGILFYPSIYYGEPSKINLSILKTPNYGGSYSLEINGEETLELQYILSDERENIYLLDFAINNEDVLEAIERYDRPEGYEKFVPTFEINHAFEAGDIIRIKNNTTGEYITSGNSRDIVRNGEIIISIHEDYLEVVTSGNYWIIYKECFDIIAIGY